MHQAADEGQADRHVEHMLAAAGDAGVVRALELLETEICTCLALLGVTGYGPIQALTDKLDETKRTELKRNWIDFHDGFKTEMGICMPRDYRIVRGTRR